MTVHLKLPWEKAWGKDFHVGSPAELCRAGCAGKEILRRCSGTVGKGNHRPAPAPLQGWCWGGGVAAGTPAEQQAGRAEGAQTSDPWPQCEWKIHSRALHRAARPRGLRSHR